MACASCRWGSWPAKSSLLTDNAPLVGLLVRGLLTLVDWGESDVVVLDLPPGTGEPFATLLQSVRFDGVVLVTTPQDVARLDAGRVLAAVREARLPVLGSVENMAYLVCPHCGEQIEVFHRGRVSRPVDAEVTARYPGSPRFRSIPCSPRRRIRAGRSSSRTRAAPRLGHLSPSPRQSASDSICHCHQQANRNCPSVLHKLRAPLPGPGTPWVAVAWGIPVLLLSIRVPLLQGRPTVVPTAQSRTPLDVLT